MPEPDAAAPSAAPGTLLADLPGCVPVCHGCPHRHLSAHDSLAHKMRFLERVLAPWRDRLEAVRGAPDERRIGYRDRVTLAARFDGGRWQFGLVRRDELVPIPHCPVHTPRVRELVRLFAEILPPAERFRLAWLHVAGAQATLIAKQAVAPVDWLRGAGPALAAAGLEGLWINWHPSAGRKLFLKTGWQLAWGEPRSRDADGLLHGPGAFQQLLPELCHAALEEALIGFGGARAVLDLYCGNGRSLRVWRSLDAEVLGVESAREAVECARLNAPGAMVLQGSCRTRLPQVRSWWAEHATEEPVAWLNPDRSGLEPEVSACLAGELRPARIAYLSCSAGTLARDLVGFESAGYRVERLVPFDFFPQTRHVEVLALLAR